MADAKIMFMAPASSRRVSFNEIFSKANHAVSTTEVKAVMKCVEV